MAIHWAKRSIIDRDIFRQEESMRGLEESVRALKSCRNEIVTKWSKYIYLAFLLKSQHIFSQHRFKLEPTLPSQVAHPIISSQRAGTLDQHTCTGNVDKIIPRSKHRNPKLLRQSVITRWVRWLRWDSVHDFTGRRPKLSHISFFPTKQG